MPKGCDRERKGCWDGDSELRKRDQVEAGGSKKNHRKKSRIYSLQKVCNEEKICHVLRIQ